MPAQTSNLSFSVDRCPTHNLPYAKICLLKSCKDTKLCTQCQKSHTNHSKEIQTESEFSSKLKQILTRSLKYQSGTHDKYKKFKTGLEAVKNLYNSQEDQMVKNLIKVFQKEKLEASEKEKKVEKMKASYSEQFKLYRYFCYLNEKKLLSIRVLLANKKGLVALEFRRHKFLDLKKSKLESFLHEQTKSLSSYSTSTLSYQLNQLADLKKTITASKKLKDSKNNIAKPLEQTRKRVHTARNIDDPIKLR